MKRHNRIKKALKLVLVITAGLLIIAGLTTYMIIHSYISKLNLININKTPDTHMQEDESLSDINNLDATQPDTALNDHGMRTEGIKDDSQFKQTWQDQTIKQSGVDYINGTDSDSQNRSINYAADGVQSSSELYNNNEVANITGLSNNNEIQNNGGLNSSNGMQNSSRLSNSNETISSNGTQSSSGTQNSNGTQSSSGTQYSNGIENGNTSRAINNESSFSTKNGSTTGQVQEIAKAEQEIRVDEKVMNLLLIGTDVKSSNNINTECFALFTVNKKSKKLITTTLSNNLYLEIPGKGKNRLVTAYRTGGADLLAKTIETNFCIRIDGYVMTDYSTYIEIVDTIGGVSVNVAKEELEPVNRNIREVNKQLGVKTDADLLLAADKYILNGKQALGYSRSWYSDNGLYISPGKQKVIILAILDKVKKFNIIELNGFLNAVLPNITTNFSEKSIMELIIMLPVYFKYKIGNLTLPVKGTEKKLKKDGYTVLDIDLQKNISELHENLYDK